MKAPHPINLAGMAAAFGLPGSGLEAQPYGSGHINDTYVATFSQAGTPVRYIFQRINHGIFKDPAALMDNILRVTEAAWSHLQQDRTVLDASRRTLRVIPAEDGKPYFRDAKGSYWRCYPFIEGARTYDIVQTAAQAREAARAFGKFQVLASGLQGPRLHETIPGFHNTRSRFDRLMRAGEADAKGRLREVKAEWDFFRSREAIVDVLLDLAARGDIPERVTHNDTKLNNVMIDNATGAGICVIDLDTVMPGLSVNDFGDAIRFGASTAAEDEQDLSRVHFDLDLYETYVQGYLSTCGESLTKTEIEMLPVGAKMMTLECGMRFLADHIAGDVYFHISRENQNLDRARTQLRLVREMERKWDAMRQIIANAI